jgi:hypothetical protein
MTIAFDMSPAMYQFGVTLTRESDSVPVVVLLDRPYVEAFRISGESIRATVSAPWVIVPDDVLTQGEERFQVVTIKPASDLASAFVVLESLGSKQIIIVPGTINLRVRITFITADDSYYPQNQIDRTAGDDELLMEVP